jgi:hypothetical protein
MIVTLQDDGVLRLYLSVEEAVRDVEALDAEETFRAVFDDVGRPFAIRWIQRNRIGRGFFGFRSAENGSYTLAPAGDPQPEALLRVIRDVAHVEPSELEPELRISRAG